MSIRSALGSLPSWPVLVVAPAVILVLGAISYGPAYRECTRLAEARAGFTSAVERAAQDGGGVLPLDQAVTASDWDQVRILQSVKLDGPLLDCPFGWDLTRIERREIITKGQLGLLSFAGAGEVVSFVEFRSDLIRFEVDDEILARSAAVFIVEAPEIPGGAFVLRPAGAGS
jgi:hypothetical protein